jgi:hypothetical protein
VLGCEISFSAELPGTQIVFESGAVSPEIADQIVRGILESAEAFTAQPHNNSLDRSVGSVFLNLFGAAKVE